MKTLSDFLEAGSGGMEEARMKHRLLEPNGIVVAEPEGPLSEEDFVELSQTVDDYLETHDRLRGLMIHTRAFPGWESLSGLMDHVRFVKEHHDRIDRVALASDSSVASLIPRLADHFVDAEVRHFDFDEEAEAISWLHGEG